VRVREREEKDFLYPSLFCAPQYPSHNTLCSLYGPSSWPIIIYESKEQMSITYIKSDFKICQMNLDPNIREQLTMLNKSPNPK